MNTGGLAVVLLGGLLGLVLALVASGLVVYGLIARNRRRGFMVSVIALALSVVAALASTTFWIVILSGRDTHGEPVRYADVGPIVFLVVAEALAMALSIAGVVRQALRKQGA